MRRFSVAVAATVFASLVADRTALAEPPEKVRICHADSAHVLSEMDGVILIINFGREIEVSEKALPAHLAHGDSEDYSPLPEGLREFFEETLEVDIPNADDCFFFSIELDI